MALSWADIQNYLVPSRSKKMTRAQYIGSDKTARNVFKKHKYHVFAQYQGSKRKVIEIVKRGGMIVDVDNAGNTDEFLNYFNSIFNFNYFVHSSTSHTGDNGKLHIVIPFVADCEDMDMYTFAVQSLMVQIGLQYFDAASNGAVDWCSDNPNQGMNGPRIFSDTTDEEYVCQEYNADREWFDVEKFVGEFDNWRDVTTWPNPRTIGGTGKTLQDPREKPGFIGACCRVYDTIESTFEDFPAMAEHYAYGEGFDGELLPNIYTYRKGTAINGLKFPEREYSRADGSTIKARMHGSSYQGTDPVNIMGDSKPQNMFDIMRIVLFGDLDPPVTESTVHTNLPSFKAFNDALKKIPRVVEEQAAAMASVVVDGFDDLTEDNDDERWLLSLEYMEVRKVIKLTQSYHNVETIIKNDPAPGGLARNELKAGRTWLLDEAPQWDNNALPDMVGRGWTDADTRHVQSYISKKYKVEFPPQKLRDAINHVADLNSFHPVRRWLESLPRWDGVERIAGTLNKYFKCKDDTYTREVSKILFVSAVARVVTPGIKYENLIIIEGPGKTGKSQFIADLSPCEDWYSASLPERLSDTKQVVEVMAQKWVIEMGELEQLLKTDASALKRFFSETTDTVRLAYRENGEDYPRSSVLIATCNPETNPEYLPLNDSGNRRYWPITAGIESGQFPHGAGELASEREQLFAEALAVYGRVGLEALQLTPAATGIATVEQQKREYTDGWADEILQFLTDPLSPEAAEGFFTCDEGRVTRVDTTMLLEHAITNGSRKQGDRAATARVARLMYQFPEWVKTEKPTRITKSGFQASRVGRGWVRN